MLIQNIEAFVHQLRERGGCPLPGRPESEIRKVFASLGQEASADVIQLYTHLDGLEEMEAGVLWQMWPLAHVKAENIVPSPHGVLFSDHFMDSWRYRLRWESGSRSSIHVDHCDPGREPVQLFASLNGFVDAYLSNPDLIIGAG